MDLSSDKTYRLTYHLARGVAVELEGVGASDVMHVHKQMATGEGTIKVGSADGAHHEVIMVRNILTLEVQEEPDGKG